MHTSKTKIITPDEELSILLIEDDPLYQQLFLRYLNKDHQRKYDITMASDGAEGLAFQDSRPMDCLLVDYSLPDQKGTQLIADLTKKLGDEMPPCIILTAGGGEEAAADALRAGASDFLSKRHISTESLSRSIVNAVEKSRLNASVRKHTKALESANDSLKLRNEEIQRFYQNVSHEVKTPLAAAREFVSIVLDGISGPVTTDQQEMLIHAIDSCDQIADHFNDLIEMTRLEAGKLTLQPKIASLSAVATRCFAATKAAIQAKNISFKSDFDDSIPLMVFDRNRMVQVFANILGNAIKYTPENGTVRFSIINYTESKSVEIAISDTGCGIAEAHLTHIFERLYQVEDAHADFTGAGLGLGLSIAKEIVVLHGGDIWAESKIGQGTTFYVRLPIEPCNSMETT